jgi:putative membrane protein
MRWVHIVVIALLATATFIFAIQNFEIVTMSFLGFGVRAPLALLVAIVYVLGMATGGSLWALLRRSFHGSGLRQRSSRQELGRRRTGRSAASLKTDPTLHWTAAAYRRGADRRLCLQNSWSVACTAPGSRFVLRRSPLFSNTFSIGVFSGRTSAISSLSPASRA